jgi:Tfp pilus assembly protein PilF
LGWVLLLGLVLNGCATDTALKKGEARRARDMGERFLGAGDYGRALQQFLIALEKDPNDPHIHYDLAWTYDRRGALDKTAYHLKEAIRLKPDYAGAYNYMGALYLRKGEVDLAIEYCQKALDVPLYLNPEEAHFNLGMAYRSRKQNDKAIYHLQRAVELAPDYAEAFYELGIAYETLRKYRKAQRAYAKALEFSPESAVAHLRLGRLLYRSGYKRKAADHFEEAIRLAAGSGVADEARRYLKTIK